MPDFLVPYWGWIKLGLYAAAAAALFMAGWTINGWRHESAEAELKAEQSRVLAVKTAEALTTERERDALKDELEITHAKHEAALAAYHDTVGHRIDVLGGLHVPGRGTCSDGTLSPASGPTAVIKTAPSECLIDTDLARRLNEAAKQCDGFLELAGLGEAYAAEIERERAQQMAKDAAN